MKKYFQEIIIFILQLLVFYAFPIFAVPTDSHGIIILVVIGTFILSMGMGGLSKSKIRFYYPVIIALLFFPAVYMHIMEFELIHSFWCLAASVIGVLTGNILVNR